MVLKCLILIGTEHYYQQLEQVFDFFCRDVDKQIDEKLSLGKSN